MERGSGVRCTVSGLMGGERVASVQIGADEERIDDAGRGARIGKTFVTARGYLGEREGRSSEQACERGDFLDVRSGVAADAIGVGLIDGVDPLAGDLLAFGTGDAEVARDGFESMIGKLPRGEVVAQDGVERVDEFTPRNDEAKLPAAGHALAESRRSDAAEGQRYAEETGARLEKR